jgi:hypothetical protein
MDKEVFWNNTKIQRTSTMEEIFDFFNSNIDALITTNELSIPPIAYFVAKGGEERYEKLISDPRVRRNMGWMVTAIFKDIGYQNFDKVRLPARLHPKYFKMGSIYAKD